MARFSINPHAGGVGRGEHISLETDVSETRAKPNPARPLVRYELSKGGRGVTTRVHILPDQFVLVETQRSRTMADEHTVDLRFVDPRPIALRKVPWRLLYAAIAITVIAAAATVMQVALPNIVQRIGGVLAPIGLGVLGSMLFALCYFLSTESLVFLSVHGRARVIAMVGPLGTIRRVQTCAADVVTHIAIARKQFKQTRQAYLRDEMREHARLYEQGAFSEEQYSEAKSRILKAHE